jgi:regulator of ribonuclease activity A
MRDIVLPDLCDAHHELVRVVEPIFSNFGGRLAFGGIIVTIKCFEDNSLVADRVQEAGKGKVLVIDAGGSLRCGMVGDNLAAEAARNEWEGLVVYGCVRDVDALAEADVGIQALAPHPLKSIKRGVGEHDLVVHFGGVSFVPGQFVYADNNGILVSPTPLV